MFAILLLILNWQLLHVELTAFYSCYLGEDYREDLPNWAFPINKLIIIPFTSNELFYGNSLDRSISNSRVCLVFIITMFYRNSWFNSFDPDQMLHSAVSDLDLHCFLRAKHHIASKCKMILSYCCCVEGTVLHHWSTWYPVDHT